MKRIILTIAFLILFAAGNVSAFEAGIFPSFSYTASGFGMGNAVVSLPAHPSNVWTNPGGLAFPRGWLFYAAPHDEVTGVRNNVRDRVFSLGYNDGGEGTWGGALIVRQNRGQAYLVGDELRGTDILEPALFLSYGRKMSETWGAGVTVYGYQQRADADELDGDMTGGVTAGILRAWDHTVRGKLPLEIRWGLTGANIGPGFDVGSGTAHHPTHVRTGFSALWDEGRPATFLFSTDMHYLFRDEGDQETRIGGGVGAELGLAGVAAIRIGYVWDADSSREETTFGFGVGNEVYPHVGGMLEYAHAPGVTDFADHIGVRLYYIP